MRTPYANARRKRQKDIHAQVKRDLDAVKFAKEWMKKNGYDFTEENLGRLGMLVAFVTDYEKAKRKEAK